MELAEAMRAFQGAAQKNPQLGMINSLWRPATPQIYVDVDRERAKSLGIPLDSAFNTLAASLGSYYVNDFNKFGRTWQVKVQADHKFRIEPRDIRTLDVRNAEGDMVPIGTLVNVDRIVGPQTILRYNLYPTASITGAAAPGYSSGQAINAMDIVELNVTDNYTPSNGAVYPDGDFGNNLQVLAQMVKLDLGLSVATVDLGGWDTHEDQGAGRPARARCAAARGGGRRGRAQCLRGPACCRRFRRHGLRRPPRAPGGTDPAHPGALRGHSLVCAALGELSPCRARRSPSAPCGP